jgi:putative Mn2+ efflux pump MntP
VKIGPSFVMMTLGSIMTFAVTAHIDGLNIHVAGVILMFAGAAAVIYNINAARSRRRTDIISEPGHTTYLEPSDAEHPHQR